MDADLTINEAAPSIDEVKEAVAKLRDGKVGHIKKSYGGLAWPMVFWTHAARESGVVGTCADDQRFKFSSRW